MRYVFNSLPGNVVYMDPDQLRINSGEKGFDIYVDTEGYAVPNRLIRRNKSIDETNEVCCLKTQTFIKYVTCSHCHTINVCNNYIF